MFLVPFLRENYFAKLIFALKLDKQQIVAIMKMIPYKERESRASQRFHYKNVEKESASGQPSLLLTPFTGKNRYSADLNLGHSSLSSLPHDILTMLWFIQ